jgi:hypothetical protein
VSRADSHMDTGIRSADRPGVVPAPPRVHGAAASLRRQPARIVLGRIEGGYTGAFEVICCDCGDRPYWDYPEIAFQLQRIRGPYTLDAGIAAYEQHLGLAT